jgi:hypothetical protein
MDIIKLNVHACAGGWCTRERQHRQWRNGQPWASGSSGWWTFLRRRWARGRYCLSRCSSGSALRWDFRKIFPRSWRNRKRALAFSISHVRLPDLVDNHATTRSSSSNITRVELIVKMSSRVVGLASLVARSRISTSWSCGSSRRYLSSSPQHDPLRVLFCGADEFSICSLRALNNIRRENPDKVASIDVVCRKDKRVGRGLKQIREGSQFSRSVYHSSR